MLKQKLEPVYDIASKASTILLVAALLMPDRAIWLLEEETSSEVEECLRSLDQLDSAISELISDTGARVAYYFDESLYPVARVGFPEQYPDDIDAWHDNNRLELEGVTHIDTEEDIPFVITSGRAYFPDDSLDNLMHDSRLEDFLTSFNEGLQESSFFEDLVEIDPSRAEQMLEQIQDVMAYGYITQKSRWSTSLSSRGNHGLAQLPERSDGSRITGPSETGAELARSLDVSYEELGSMLNGIVGKYNIEDPDLFMILALIQSQHDLDETMEMLVWANENLELPSNLDGKSAYYELVRRYFIYTNQTEEHENFSFYDAVFALRILAIADDFKLRVFSR